MTIPKGTRFSAFARLRQAGAVKRISSYATLNRPLASARTREADPDELYSSMYY